MTPEISVVVATHNRAASLPQVLADLARQQTGGEFRFEVVVADNVSTDGTRAAVERLAAGYPVPLTYVYEPRQGKAYALNTALGRTSGEWVAFTDDDVSVEPTWLQTIWRAAREHGADGIGGPVRPLWVGPRPAWLSDTLLRQLGVVDYGPAVFQAFSRETPFIGPNMAYRRALFLEHGGFEPADPGEDSEWYLRMLRAGRKLIYQPAAVVMHKIDGRRLTPRALGRRFFRHGRGYGVKLQQDLAGRRVCRVPLWVIRLYAELHVHAARAWLAGDRSGALWHWLRREIYRGVIAQCVADWWGHVPAPRPKPFIANRSVRDR